MKGQSSYIQVSGGWNHSVLLRSDGMAVACPSAMGVAFLQYPVFGRGTDFCTQVSAGWEYTVLLRNDGTAVACGLNGDIWWWTVQHSHFGCWNLLHPGLCQGQTVLLRSDGNASTCGRSTTGQYIPSLRNNCRYICDRSMPVNATVRVLQLDFIFHHDDDDVLTLTCPSLSGHEVLSLRVRGAMIQASTWISPRSGTWDLSGSWCTSKKLYLDKLA